MDGYRFVLDKLSGLLTGGKDVQVGKVAIKEFSARGYNALMAVSFSGS